MNGYGFFEADLLRYSDGPVYMRSAYGKAKWGCGCVGSAFMCVRDVRGSVPDLADGYILENFVI